MPIEFSCPECSRRLRVPDGSAGKHCMCPGCQVVVPIPELQPSKPEPVQPISVAVPPGKIQVPCPQCQHVLLCDAKLEGTRGLCPQCKTVFTISTKLTNQPVTKAAFVFACPVCRQLFDGKPEMAGRKGKCPSCQEVFVIEQHHGQSNPSQPALDLDAISSQSAPSAKEDFAAEKMQPSGRAQPVVLSTANPRFQEAMRSDAIEESHAEKLTIECPTCSKHLQTPATLAGKTIQCPMCKSKLVVPQSDIHIPEESIFSLEPGGNLWGDDLLASVPPANPFANTITTPNRATSIPAFTPASKNPYAAPMSVGLGLDSGFSNSSDERTRRKYLNHEASIQSFGFLFMLGAILGGLVASLYFILGFGLLFRGRGVAFTGIFIFSASFVAFGISVFQWFAAIGLRRLTPFGRVGGTVIGAIGLIGFPVGTLVSAYLLYLLWSSKGTVVFSPEYQRVIQATPNIKYKTSIIVWIFLGLLVLLLAIGVVGAIIAIRASRNPV